MGGRLMHWMDIAAAMAAQKHTRAVCVTASVNNVSFNYPIKLGNVVTIIAKCVRAFNTSVEVHLEVWTQNMTSNEERIKCNEAFLTFVALDNNGEPAKVPPIEPLTDDEQHLYDGALLRRQLKLLNAGKITLDKAPELKRKFIKWIEGTDKSLLGD